MKFGLIYYKDTNNLGDDVLSYAGERFLPNKTSDYVIDREKLDEFTPDTNDMIACILNGWYIHDETSFPPSPYIYPLYIGTHFSDAELFGDNYIKYASEHLKKYSPIGCRDNSTCEKLSKYGIDNYFSGCLTLTLDRFEDVPKEDIIVLVDVPKDVEEYVRSIYTNTKYDIKIVSHQMEDIPGLSWNERKLRVEEYLKLYQSAYLVITSRLHCALPSIALGTKVCMVYMKNDDFKRRISSFSKLFSGYYLSEEIIEGEADGYFLSPDDNADISDIRNRIISICNEFIDKAQKDELINDKVEIISIENYNDVYINKVKYIKDVFKNLKEEYKRLCIQNADYDEVISLRQQNKELLALLNKSKEIIESLTKV